MEKIVRLTESDLTRIVKRVINETSKPKAQKCSELDGKISDVVAGMTEKNKNLDLKKGGVAMTVAGQQHRDKSGRMVSNWEEKVINEDPYSYVKLYNGKYCIKHQSKNNWTEVTNQNQIISVEKALNTKVDPMSIYKKHNNMD
jgi:hypothetical protein